MKAEHRKELRTSPLQDWLSQWWADLKGGPKTSTLVFWLAVLLVVALIVGWQLYRRHSAARLAGAWMGVADAASTDDLAKVAAEDPGTPPALAARFAEARTKLRQGLEKLAAIDEKDRGDAQDKVKAAGELYGNLANEAGDTYPLLKQEALMGAAKALESQGDLDGALNYYSQLARLNSDSALVARAKESVKQLEPNSETRKKVQEFYDQLKQPAAR